MTKPKTFVRFEPAGHVEIDLDEPSDVAAFPGGGFLIVGDRADVVLLLAPDGKQVRVELPAVKDGKSGLEAVAYDPIRRRLFVAAEERRLLLRYAFDPLKSAPPALEAKIELDLGKKANKGVEGLAYVPVEHSPTRRPQLVAANERNPHLIALLEDDGSGEPVEVAFPPALAEECSDFAALAVDPVTGHLFVASEESATLAELSWRRTASALALSLKTVTPLLDKRGHAFERVEGIAFDERGDLHVLTENQRKLHRLRRVGAKS
jgi:uncharacterized protein YjiK